MKQVLPFLQVFFDIDGTLLLAGGVGRRVIDGIVQERCGIPDALRAIRLHGNTDPRILEETAARYAPEDPEGFFLRMKDEFLARMPGALRGNCRLLPGVGETLLRLQARGIPMGIVTGNYRECAEAKLEDTGISMHFTAGVFTATDHADRTEILRKALEANRVVPQRTLYVGDTPWDVQAARDCGCAVFAVATSLYSAGHLAAAGADFAVADMRFLADGRGDFLFRE